MAELGCLDSIPLQKISTYMTMANGSDIPFRMFSTVKHRVLQMSLFCGFIIPSKNIQLIDNDSLGVGGSSKRVGERGTQQTTTIGLVGPASITTIVSQFASG